MSADFEHIALPQDAPRAVEYDHRLESGASCAIMLGYVMEGAEVSWRERGIAANNAATISAGEFKMSVLDTRAGFGTKPNVTLVSHGVRAKNQGRGAQIGVVRLAEGRSALIGRGRMEGQLATNIAMHYTNQVARQQATVLFSGSQLHVFNHYPTNPTKISGDLLLERDSGSEGGKWLVESQMAGTGYVDMYTSHVERELGDGRRSNEAPYGYFESKYPIIGRNSPTVRGGVYLTRSSEAVLVDHAHPLIRQASTEIMHIVGGMFRERRDVSTKEILQAASNLAARKLRYDLDAAERLSEPFYYGKGVIHLSDYLKMGVGVCRHQNLLAAVLMEELIDTGYLIGTARVARNKNTREDYGHAWAEFDELGNVDQRYTWVLDPANTSQGNGKTLVVTKIDAMKRARHNYFLSEQNT